MTKPTPRRLWRRRTARLARCIAAMSTLAAASLLFASSSYAGTYIVDSCRVPSGVDAGASAPLEISEGATEAPGKWNRISSGTGMYGETCGESGGSLMAGLTNTATHSTGDIVTWRFTAPPEEQITKATIWRAGDAEGGPGYMLWMSGPGAVPPSEVAVSENVFSGCAYSYGCTSMVGDLASPLSSSNKVPVPANDLGGPHLYVNATCTRATCPEGAGDENGNAVVINIYATEMELEEAQAPVVSNVTGELATASSVSGEAALSYQAEDEGSGVYEQVVEVDGKEVQRAVVDPDEGRCAPLSEGAAPLTFLYPEPCPHSVTGHVSLETDSLSNATHSLSVSVTNAAGDSTPVLERQISVANGSKEGPESSKSGEEGPGEGAGTGEPEGSPNPEGGGEEETGPGEGATGQKGGSEQPVPTEEGSTGGRTGSREEAPTSPSSGSDLVSPDPASALASSFPSATQPSTEAPAPNGSPASSSARLIAKWLDGRGSKRRDGGKLLVTGYGGHRVIAGRLTTARGAPIRDAIVTAEAIPAYGGAHLAEMKALRTSASGRFRVSLPPHVSSRSIELGYAPTLHGAPIAHARLRLQVSASVKLIVTPSVSHAGGTIRLRGRVLGSPMPRVGKEVVLEARSSGTRWLKFDVLHTRRDGTFAASHRFRLPGPIRYEFRAVCPQEADFPFATGDSSVVGVFER